MGGYVPGVTTGIAPTNPSIMFGSPASFSTAATQQAGDYDTIMNNYRDLLKKQQDPLNPTNTFKPITPTLAPYTASPDVTAGMKNLADLTTTGGYSSAGISDLRARGISPIRSIYANAQENLNRQKALQGGYSPNYTAASAKMARQESDQIGKATTDVNAGIAQDVASNRLSIAPSYSNAAQSENAARTAVEQHNADETNRINELNAQMVFQHNEAQRNGMFGTIEGMRSLYGTTPALTNLFGTQVGQAAQLGQGQQQINNQKLASGRSFAGTVLGS